LAPAHVLADKAYDADTFLVTLQNVGAKPVIPPRRNRKVQRNYDRTLYKERNLVERFFNKLKHFRRVATRYDKLLVNFLGFVKIAAIAILMRSLNCHYDLGQPQILTLKKGRRINPSALFGLECGEAFGLSRM